MNALKLKPACKDYLWGGTRLKSEYNKQTTLKKIAETWELSSHPDGASIIQNGEYKNKSFAEYLAAEGKKVLGTNAAKFTDFPVLIKLIDAADRLSVQVHPSDEYAQKVEGQQGKTEMWYIIDCEPGAELLYGFKHNISKEEMAKRIEEDTLLDVVQAVPVHPGDVFFIEAGTLHAIGKGILLAEIQQNSNVTYRIYDYGRRGADGKLRELHIQKALEVTDLCPVKKSENNSLDIKNFDGYKEQKLADCNYFKVSSLDICESASLSVDELSFAALLCISGEAGLKYSEGEIKLNKGDSVFLPAGLGDYFICGKAKILKTTV